MDKNTNSKTREKLIDATIESVYQHGYSDTTVASISDLADVSAGTLHHHFTGKDQLLEFAMRRLLADMQQRAMEGYTEAANPRGKLWAVISSVLGDEQSNSKTTEVWLSFWVQAEHDDSLRNIRDIYNRRLYSNVRYYIEQVLVEIGASTISVRAHSAAMMIIAMMHGVWVSYAIREGDLSHDLAHGRQLVWDMVEMLLSRAREPLPEESGTVIAVSAGLMQNSSIEVLASDIKKVSEWREYAADGMRVYIPHFRHKLDSSERIRQAVSMIDAGLTPVVHIAARNVNNEAELEQTIAGVSAVGVKDVLLLGGGENPPIGDYHCALQMLETGLLKKYNIERVGFAGHPETHPDQPQAVMRAALKSKIAAAQSMGLSPYIVTQFCFSTRPFFDYLDWLKDEGFNIPVYLGIAGRVNATKLIKFSMLSGIGPSVRFLKRQFSKTVGLVNYSPEGLLAELAARSSLRNYPFPVSIHFYPFGATTETLALITDAAMLQETA